MKEREKEVQISQYYEALSSKLPSAQNIPMHQLCVTCKLAGGKIFGMTS